MSRLHRLLLGILLTLLAVPIPAVHLLRRWTADRPEFDWLANRTLVGVTLPRQEVTFSLKTWFDGSFQQSVTKWVNENFAGRELAIRCINQALWFVCGKSYMASETLISGRENQIIEKQYIARLLHVDPPLPSEAEMDRQAAGISRLCTRLRKYNVPFLVLFTPSKAETLLHALPARYHANQIVAQNIPDRLRLKARLSVAGVPVLDGAELTRNLGGILPLPPFPKTGTHWTDLAAFYTAEKTLRMLEQLGHRPLARLRLSDIKFSDVPRPPDDDLLQVLNLARVHFDHYAYGTVSREPAVPARQGRLVEIGGSFLHSLNSLWEEAEVWKEIDHLYYFSLSQIRYPGHDTTPINVGTIDWAATIGTADAIVLEINESIVTTQYISAFLQEALNKLPDVASPVEASFPQTEWQVGEADASHRWHWSCKSSATVNLRGIRDKPVRLTAALMANGKQGIVRIIAPDGRIIWQGTVAAGSLTPFRSEPFQLSAGAGSLHFESDIDASYPGNGDTRMLAFSLWDQSFEEVTSDKNSAEAIRHLELGPRLTASFPESEWETGESDALHRWHWSRGSATLNLHGARHKLVRLKGSFTTSRDPGKISVRAPNGRIIWEGQLTPNRFTEFRTETFQLTEDSASLQIETDIEAGAPGNGDTRRIAFGLWDLSFEESESGETTSD